ncbi:MAG TPA: AtpZ/AtpI family protein [Candidatus Saccharimonadales bacterium]|jgi:hypothetical protein|nr:AtpZ/AtpI family protein [Candidatus Saccharimonadales bacterium]
MVKSVKNSSSRKIISKSTVVKTIDYRSAFIGSALTMSWQLAITVLVPIIGGHELDIHLKTNPVWTLIGVAVAFIGTLIIIFGVLHSEALSPKEVKKK